MSDSDRKTLVQYGAGNIGRSFIGQVFARNGWNVVFIDINEAVVNELNSRGCYDVHIKHPEEPETLIKVDKIRAVNGTSRQDVINEIAGADLLCTSVGKGVLPHIAPLIAEAIEKRAEALDIILAENIHNGGDYMRSLLRSSLPASFPQEKRVGLVETSIGKMVPIMKEEDLQKDPLAVFAEPYNNLIVDKKGFLGPIPSVDDLKTVDNIAAYVDRKLFIHNLGHASAAYLGYGFNENFTYIWESLEIPSVFEEVRSVMREAAAALLCEYPEDFTQESLEEHINDLLYRFQNKALGDTIYRVGRDLYRKLGREDRIVGAIKLAEKHKLPSGSIRSVFEAACRFRGKDDRGNMFERDKAFHEEHRGQSPDEIMAEMNE